MPLFGKGSRKSSEPGEDFEQEAARQLAESRRQAAERLSGSRMDPGGAMSPPATPTPGRGEALRPPSGPGPAAPFGTPPSAGGAATPADERRAITDMAMEDLQRQRQAAAPADSPFAAPPVRVPEEELERRRPPAPGETLPGVPPPHIPSEDLRDQALREILERKERLDREYMERHGHAREGAEAGAAASPAARVRPKPPRRKTKLHGIALRKKELQEAQEKGSAPGAAAPKGPSLKRPAAPSEPEPEPEPEPAPAPASATTSTGDSVEEALAEIKGVGPVIRSALRERFDSVQAIKEADALELTEVNGIGPALAKRIKTSL